MNPKLKEFAIYVVIVVGGIILFLLEEAIRLRKTGFETKTLWDWMELLIIPLVLALGAFFLNQSERTIERHAVEDRAKIERERATDRQQEAALQSYLDRIEELLLKVKLRTARNKEVRNLARIRTLTVLRQLDGNRKRIVINFLYEAGLISKEKPIIDLAGADLTGADLQRLRLVNSTLQRADLTGANLNGANLYGVNLQSAKLDSASLSNANLTHADLVMANFTRANLSTAYLNDADLSNANLTNAALVATKLQKANLFMTTLFEANLWDADLTGANLYMTQLLGAHVTIEQLATAESLHDAIMPDGTKHK